MWWRRFDIDAVDELQILWSLVITTCRLFIWVVFFTSSIFSSFTDIDMSLIFFVDQLWLLEKVLLYEWKLCMMTFLIMQRFNIVWTALNWDLLILLTFIQTQNRIKRFVINIMYRWILLSILYLLVIIIVIVIVIHTFLWHWFRLNSWETLCYLYQVNKTLWERKSLVVYTTASCSRNNEIDTVLSSNESIAFIQHVMLK